jgi:hypothetical protein
MSELEMVIELAQQALTIVAPGGSVDSSLWDRGQRLVRNAEYICQLPELAKAEVQIDHFCLMAAAYFNDTGLARYLDDQGQGVRLALSGPNGEELLDFSTQVVEEKLASVVTKTRIEKINRIITESGNHFTKMMEAMILSDARNLDDMGAAGLFNEFKGYVIGGKGACDAVRSSFRFEQVRRLAEQRLSAAEYFMNQLKVETEAQDLEELISGLSKRE